MRFLSYEGKKTLIPISDLRNNKTFSDIILCNISTLNFKLLAITKEEGKN